MAFCAGLCGRGCWWSGVVFPRVSAWEGRYVTLAEIQTEEFLNVQ